MSDNGPDISELTGVFGLLASCCLHEPQWQPADVDRVLAGVWCGKGGTGWQSVNAISEDGFTDWKPETESESVFAVKLKDGSYGLLHESEDFTGHGGCVCDAFTGRYTTADDLLAACMPGYGLALAVALNEGSDE